MSAIVNAMSIRRAAVIAMLSCGAAGVAAAQTPVTLNDSAAGAKAREVIDEARAKGLPVEPLEDKVREGVLKHAEGTRIAAVVSKLAERLELARTALAPAARPPEIIAGADALQLGVPDKSLKRVRQAGGQQPLEVPLGVLAQLVSQGVPVDPATDKVVELLTRKTAPAQFIALAQRVADDVNTGMTALAALDLRMKGIIPPGAVPSVATDAAFGPASTTSGGKKKP